MRTTEINLEQYRVSQGWSYDDLCNHLGLTHRQMARQYALGIRWPSPQRMRLILSKCAGGVSMEAMLTQRCTYLESIGKLAPQVPVEPVE